MDCVLKERSVTFESKFVTYKLGLAEGPLGFKTNDLF